MGTTALGPGLEIRLKSQKGCLPDNRDSTPWERTVPPCWT